MSNNGKWCRECIEWEWPQISLGDGKHWLVWKVVFEREQEFYFGFLNCPYKVDFISIPWGLSNWFLSPLGALKQIGKMGGKGKCRIIVSVVRISDTFLREDNILESFSPALTLEVFEPEDFSFSPQEATALLDALPYDEKAIAEVEAIEKKFRPEVYGKVELPRKIPLKGKARRIFFDNLCRKLEMEGIEIPYLKRVNHRKKYYSPKGNFLSVKGNKRVYLFLS